jgi:hypothetical protein
VLFDGEFARNHYSTDIDHILANYLMCYFGYWPFVNKDEVWIDSQQADNIVHLLYIAILAELNTASTYALEREMLVKFSARAGGGEIKYPTILREEKLFHFWKVQYVDGNQVRHDIDPSFSSGGHHEVYSYIPQFTIWIDAAVVESERPHIVVHEFVEWVAMYVFNRSYDFGHELAAAFEAESRRKRSGAIYRGEERYPLRHKSNEEVRQSMMKQTLRLRRDWFDLVLKSKGAIPLAQILVLNEEFTQLQLV